MSVEHTALEVLELMTKQAAGLRKIEPHTVPGQVPIMIAALERLAVEMADKTLISIPQLAGFLEVSGGTLSTVVLWNPQVERERLAYIDRLNGLAPDQLAVKAE